MLPDYSSNVIVKKSAIIDSKNEDGINSLAGNGLFASRKFSKGEVICLYAGLLIDAETAKYMDPTYIVNFENGRGLKLVGNIPWGAERGYIGHMANSIHPFFELPAQNAKYDLKGRFAVDSEERRSTFIANNFGLFPLVAKTDINIEEEIIVDYGKGHWATVTEWVKNPKIKSEEAIARDLRYVRRLTKH